MKGGGCRSTRGRTWKTRKRETRSHEAKKIEGGVDGSTRKGELLGIENFEWGSGRSQKGTIYRKGGVIVENDLSKDFDKLASPILFSHPRYTKLTPLENIFIEELLKLIYNMR